MNVKRTAIAVALAASSGVALAQDPAPFTGNITLASDYKFRGFTQTRFKPALQGGFDYAHKSGFYLGNWNSNVAETLYDGASLETDFYGGYKFTVGNLNYDVGAIYYAYSGSGKKYSTIDNKEIYFGLGVGPITAKLYYSLGDYFSTQSLYKALNAGQKGAATDGTTYFDLAATHDLGDGWGINAHVGFLNVKNGTQNGLIGNSVTDYKIGVTKDISGWVLGAAYLTTSKKNFFTTSLEGTPVAAGTGKVLVSLAKTF